MNKKIALALVLVAALAAPAFAGEYKCTASTQECLDQMAQKLRNKGWVGLELDRDDDTGALTVRLVIDDSPAQAAGFKVGDKLVAVDDIVFAKADEQTLREHWDTMTPGKKVAYRVDRNGHEKEIDVTLAKLPDDVMAKWIGMHMLEHAATATAQK